MYNQNVKKFLSLSIICLVFLSCCQNNKETIAPAQIVGKWQVVEIGSSYESSTPGKIYPAATLGYEMFYEFTIDSTFKKYLSTGLQTGGTYSIRQFNGAYYADLYYQPEIELENQRLQFSCSYGELALKLTSSEQLIEDNNGCDGSKWFYQKIE